MIKVYKELALLYIQYENTRSNHTSGCDQKIKQTNDLLAFSND